LASFSFSANKTLISNIEYPFCYQMSQNQIWDIHFAIRCLIDTLGPSWNFSLAESLASLSLQYGPQSGIIISQTARHPPSHPANRLQYNENLIFSEITIGGS
jgi:hypothetical protein